MNSPGIKLTEWALMHPQLSQDAKLVLGATLAVGKRDARQRQLEEWLPMNRDTVQAAQDELEASGIVTYRRPKARRVDGDLYMDEPIGTGAVHTQRGWR